MKRQQTHLKSLSTPKLDNDCEKKISANDVKYRLYDRMDALAEQSATTCGASADFYSKYKDFLKCQENKGQAIVDSNEIKTTMEKIMKFYDIVPKTLLKEDEEHKILF